MSLPEFLAELRSRGIQISADGDRLKCNAPVGALTPDLRDRMRERKAEILEFLRAADAAAQKQPAIVPLQPKGGLAPVFGVAGHNGDVFTYRALAQSLGPDQPFFGLRPPGLDGHSEPLDRVEDLASYFADQIRAFRPSGPVVVAGYCAGGAIAYELAQELERRGTPVESVAMFGCPYPPFFRFTTVRQLPGRVATRARALARLSSVAEYRQSMTALVQRARQLLTPAAPAPAGADDDLSARRTRLEQTTVAAVRRYVPARFPGRVNLFLPNRQWRRSAARPLRWQSLARHSEVYVGPDDCAEETMLRSPAAQTIAALFAVARDQRAPVELKQGA